MAHIVIMRIANSMVIPWKGRLGVHEQMEREISRRKYPIKGNLRDGWNTPIHSEWKIIDYRLKEESIAPFINDLKPVVLNPENNNITLWEIFISKKHKKSHVYATVGPTIMIIRWLFKWLNRKKTTAGGLLIGAILMFSPLLFIAAALVWFNPFKPVPVPDMTKHRRLVPGYSYNFCFGKLSDKAEYDRTTGEFWQDDVL